MGKRIDSYIRNIEDPYDYSKFITVEHRSNNPKRDFLFCNMIQGKHIPTDPSSVRNMVEQLSKQVLEKVDPKKVVVVGFAETATCLGNIMAQILNCSYVMQTTREDCSPYGKLIDFEEEHSHATQQSLYGKMHNMAYAEYVLFVEDEISTGKTILNFIQKFNEIKPGLKYGVASVCNWQTDANRRQFEALGIDIFALIKGEIADIDGKMNTRIDTNQVHDVCDIHNGEVADYGHSITHISAEELTKPVVKVPKSHFLYERLGHKYNEVYNRILEINMARHIKFVPSFKDAEDILVLGTEEFMYLPYRLALYLKNDGIQVSFHATSRSSIDIMEEVDRENSGLEKKFKIRSAYDTERETYVYNLRKYDEVIVVTDSRNEEALNRFTNDIVNALTFVGNSLSHIHIIHVN